jgi:hypothetical protein
MAYVPDKAIERLKELSPTSGRMFLQYCKQANQDTGECYPSIESVAVALGIRTDHAKRYERELIKKGWIEIITKAGAVRIVRIIMGWSARADRKKKSAQSQTDKSPDTATPQNLGKSRPQTEAVNKNLVDSDQNLVGRSPKLGENLPKLCEPYKEYNQPTNQPIEPADEPEESRSPVGSPSRRKKNSPADPRGSHPAIVAVKSFIGRYPNKLTWDGLITALGEEFDRERLKACALAWAKVSPNMHNLAWVFEWYADGIPERSGGARNGSTDKQCKISERNSGKADAKSATQIGAESGGDGFKIVEPGRFNADVRGVR